MFHLYLENSMVEQGQNSRAKGILALGWILMGLCILAMLFAVWMPIYVKIRPNQEFFFLDEQVPYLYRCCVVLISYSAVALFQVLVVSKLMYSTLRDDMLSAAAESAMKLARVFSIAASLVCFFSFVIVMRTYQTWYAYLQARLH